MKRSASGSTVHERGSTVLQDLCHAFASAQDEGEAASSAARWVRAAIGSDDVSVQIARPDGAGRLRVFWRDGEVPDIGRLRTARRRAAFQAGTPVHLELPSLRDRGMALFPLVCRGARLGTLDVVAPEKALQESWAILSAVASQLAIVLFNLSQREELRLEVETLGGAATLGRDLLRAGRPEAALELAVRFLWEQFHVPVAAWVAGDGSYLALSAVMGLGSRKRKELRSQARTMPRWAALTRSERSAWRRRFGDVVGARQVAVFDAGDALVFAESRGPRHRALIEVVGSLLEEVLPLLATTALARERDEQLDVGIAWTAHELRGPLLGVKAVLELLLLREAPREEAMLRRSLRELEQLVGDTEGILGWAVGARTLDRRPGDVVRIVKEAVESCRFAVGIDEIVVVAPERAIASVDDTHLRAAVANLLRNAVTYSEPGSPVEVRVADEGDHLRVSVRDRGPGVPAAERVAIFDPFVRGDAATRNRQGRGLGLFIVRRVVEAHGGSIWVDSNDRGATFHIRLPVEGREQRRFAS